MLVAGEEQERLLEALLTLARGQRGLDRRAPVDLAAVTRDVLAARGTEIAASGLEMAVTLEPALLAGDRALTERGVANLIDNALRHNVPGGAVWVTVGTESGQAVLTVANTGAGRRGRPRSAACWSRSRRGGTRVRRRGRVRPSGDGLGLGLPIVQAIAAAHGAALTVAARPEGGGLAAELAFPAARSGVVSPGSGRRGAGRCRSGPGGGCPALTEYSPG